MKRTLLMLSVSVALAVHNAYAAEPSLEEKLEILQKEIDEIKAEMAKNKGQTQPQTQSEAQAQGAAPAHAYHYGGLNIGNTTVGGYGEAIYNNFTRAGRNDQITLRRFILYLGHKFNDRLRFHSETEFEHGFVEAGKDRGGEVALEQAYLEYGLTQNHNVRAGLLLVPSGIMNETHEPATFYGVERNRVETVIIPTTWRELGVALQGQLLPGLEYNIGGVSSLDTGRFDEPGNGLRETRSSGSRAAAENLAIYAALNYRSVPGLLLGTSVFTGNTGQNGASNPALKGVNARLTLWDVHAQYNVGRLHLQGLYARGMLGDALAVTQATGNTAPSAFYGWYTEAAYRVWQNGDFAFSPFVRYERYNTQQGVAPGFAADPRNNERVTTLGFNFNVHPQVVFKFDYRNFSADNTKDSLSLGVGYQF
jgi:hypothetical protein